MYKRHYTTLWERLFGDTSAYNARREARELEALYDQVRAQYRASHFAKYDADQYGEMAAKVLLHVMGDRRNEVPPDMVGAIYTLARELVSQEPLLAFLEEPRPSFAALGPSEGMAL